MTAAVVAIVTRTKNRPVLLERAFNSALSQTFSDWHQIVVNDGGDPAPVDALAERYRDRFAGRLTIVHNPASLGMEAASNVGIRGSDSTYVVIHDDDDSWEPEFLATTTSFLESSERHRGVVTHSTRVVESLGPDGIVEESRALLNAIENVTAATIAATNLYPPIAFLFERATLADIGLYREDLPVLGDWEFNVRFIQRFDIAVIPRALANWHHRPASGDPAQGNSIFAGAEKHANYRALLRNEWLRRDLEAGRTGVGTLAGIGAAVEALLHNRDTVLAEEIRSQLASRDSRIAELHTRVEQQIAEILGLHDQARQRDAKIVELHAQLERTIADAQHTIADAQEQTRVRDATIDALKAETRSLEVRLGAALSAGGSVRNLIGKVRRIVS